MENIFFNGGGFSGFFEHVGAINYIRENNLSFNKYYGVSAGVSAIIMLLLEYDIDDFISFLDNIYEGQILGKKIDISDIHIKCINYGIKRHPDAYKILSNTLFIGITTSNGFVWKSEFTSNIELANACLCSANIPILSSYRATIDNMPTLDGGFGCMKTHLPNNVITVSTTIYFPLCMIYPSSYIIRQLYIANGYVNMKYFRRESTLSSNLWGHPLLINIVFCIDNLLPKEKSITDLDHFHKYI